MTDMSKVSGVSSARRTGSVGASDAEFEPVDYSQFGSYIDVTGALQYPFDQNGDDCDEYGDAACPDPLDHLFEVESDVEAFNHARDPQARGISRAFLCRDVMVSTPSGPTPVQDLKVGDPLITADGRLTTLRKLHVLSRQTWHVNSTEQAPIRIEQDAISTGIPSRDMTVSPGQAIEIDGRLFDACALVNGASIYPLHNGTTEGFTYFGLQTEAHEVILAQDCPVETVFNPYPGHLPAMTEMTATRIGCSRLVPTSLQKRLREHAQSKVLPGTAA